MIADPAVVVAVARAWLGTPYYDQASLRGVGCDCLGLARGVWREVVGAETFPIPPYSRDWGESGPREVLAEGTRRMMVEIAIPDAMPGALVLFRMTPRAIAKHVGILPTPDRFIHSYEWLGVVEELLTPIIWATDFREETRTTSQGGGKGGGGGTVTTTEYLYFASFAVALCEGPITGIGRVWADGKAMDMTGVTWRWYPGDEVQTADPFISAKMGAANTPAYRGTAYVVLEELDLAPFGNRLPQISFEVFRPLADLDTAEGLVCAVTLIPASGEFAYATVPVKKTSGSGGATVAENLNAIPETPDIVVALDRLQFMAPAVESVSLVVAWFGDDLRAGNSKVRPGVEVAAKTTTPSAWVVNGVSRANAFLVSRDVEDRPVYGGTPADFAVVQATREMKARGLRVTFYPFLLLDVPSGNTKPDPYSDNAATTGQPTFPWRGRITCSPAAGYVGSVDKTGAAASQVSALFGTATPANFSVSGGTVSWTGPVGEWSLRRMILHYAHLCVAAGGVDAFLIGSEMPGLTTIRSAAATYPAVQAFRALAVSFQ